MATNTAAAPAETPSTAPKEAGAGPARIVLIALILVAAVANLNLSVANVALPTIGAAFDASQVQLNLVAVAYSLGLACSVLWLGALGDRYGRKMMLLLGTALAIPASLIAAFAPSIEILFAARLFGGLAAGMAYPTTLALITALWSGPARTKAIAMWSALGGGVAMLGPMIAGFLLLYFDVGFGLSGDLAAGSRGPVHGVEARARPRQRGDRARRQPGRHPLDGARRNPHPGHQLCGGPQHAHPGVGSGGRHGGRLDSLRHPPAAGQEPALRSQSRLPPDLLGGGGGRDHRVRLADGRHVHRPAVPAERARLLDLPGRGGHPTGGGGPGSGRAAFGETRRGARRAPHAARWLRLLRARLPDHAAALAGGRPVPGGCPRLHSRWDRRGVRGHTRLAFTHRFRSRHAGGYGIGHGGPAA